MGNLTARNFGQLSYLEELEPDTGSVTPELSIISRSDAVDIKRSTEERFTLKIPSKWKPPVAINRHAQLLGEETVKWITSLGCPDVQIHRLIDFQSSHYVGIPFPVVDYEGALLISKYLSLWLLWDDVEIENGKGGWRLETQDIIAGTLPANASIYDTGWFALLRQAAGKMSPQWVKSITRSMFNWNKAAQYESRISRRYRETGIIPTFAQSLLTRIDTIGMYATAYLVEYANGVELPAEFHKDPITWRMKILANNIVGLGNEIFSFAKDYASGYVNVIAVLAAESGMPLLDAFARIIDLHNSTLQEFDELETRLPNLGPTWASHIKQWTQQMRYCSLGFSVWESQAPRYNKMKILAEGRILEPTFVYD